MIFFRGDKLFSNNPKWIKKILDSSWDLLEEAQQKNHPKLGSLKSGSIRKSGSDGKRYRSFPPTAHRRSRVRGCGCLEGISFARQKLLVVWFQCKPIYLLGEWSVFLAKHGETMRNARHESSWIPGLWFQSVSKLSANEATNKICGNSSPEHHTQFTCVKLQERSSSKSFVVFCRCDNSDSMWSNTLPNST